MWPLHEAMSTVQSPFLGDRAAQWQESYLCIHSLNSCQKWNMRGLDNVIVKSGGWWLSESWLSEMMGKQSHITEVWGVTGWRESDKSARKCDGKIVCASAPQTCCSPNTTDEARVYAPSLFSLLSWSVTGPFMPGYSSVQKQSSASFPITELEFSISLCTEWLHPSPHKLSYFQLFFGLFTISSPVVGLSPQQPPPALQFRQCCASSESRQFSALANPPLAPVSLPGCPISCCFSVVPPQSWDISLIPIILPSMTVRPYWSNLLHPFLNLWKAWEILKCLPHHKEAKQCSQGWHCPTLPTAMSKPMGHPLLA